MSLPTLSTLNTTQDTNKQLANIRSYLVQLKDELEAELSNVTYDMLSASLQKKIDSINEDIAAAKSMGDINAQLITAQYAKFGDLLADNLTVANAYADTVSAKALNVANAYADTVSAKALNVANAYADTVSAKALNVANANIDTAYTNCLNASKLYADDIVAGKVTANQVRGIIGEYGFITASYITATNINAALNQATLSALKGVSANTITCSSYTVADPYGSQKLYTLRPAVMNGKVVLAASV